MTRTLRIAITGGSGFIGTRLTRALRATGAEVVCLDVNPPSESIPWVSVDIRDEDALAAALAGIDGVFHLAAAVGVDACLGDEDRVVSINMHGTSTVIAACRRASVSRLVFSSSSEVYGDGVRVPFHEDDELRPKSTYGKTKVACEQMLQDAAGDDLVVRVVRLFNVYGPGQREDFVVPRFVRQALEGSAITVYGDGKQIRCYTHVDDAIEGFLRVFEETLAVPAFRIYNIGRPEPYSVLDVAEAVVAMTDSSSTVTMLPLGIDTLRCKDIEVFHRVPDVTRARHALGFDATIDIQDGIAEIVDAVRSEEALLV